LNRQWNEKHKLEQLQAQRERLDAEIRAREGW
jgi:hypothetical protein